MCERNAQVLGLDKSRQATTRNDSIVPDSDGRNWHRFYWEAPKRSGH